MLYNSYRLIIDLTEGEVRQLIEHETQLASDDKQWYVQLLNKCNERYQRLPKPKMEESLLESESEELTLFIQKLPAIIKINAERFKVQVRLDVIDYPEFFAHETSRLNNLKYQFELVTADSTAGT